MNSWLRALRFVATQQSGARAARSVKRSSVSITAGKLRVNADIYLPKGNELRTIVFLHGMSPLGISDPRQVIAATSLAAAGFRVLCPELPEIRNLLVDPQSVSRFQAVLGQIVANKELCPKGQCALFAPSFSGAICLKAAASPLLKGHISAVAALGAFSRIERSLHHLMQDQSADPYARLIILANFLPLLPEGKKTARYYFAAAHDNWRETAASNPLLPGFEVLDTRTKELRRLPVTTRKLIERIENDIVFRTGLADRLLKVMTETLLAYNVSDVAPQIEAPVFLLHGAGDNVIPPRESAELSPLLRHGRLVITPLMGHSHASVSLRMLADVWRLLSGFAWFFRNAAR